MLDLSVVILTFNEEIHIRRCIENIKPIAKEIFIVDSFSTDKTVVIAESLGAKIYRNTWENNYARQFNWALTHLPTQTNWVLRLDADEYLTPESIDELNNKLDRLPEDITGVILKRRHVFIDKWIKKGTYPVKLMRLFRYKKAFCEQRWMDEHIQLTEGVAIEFEHDFVDHNLNDLSWWITKHNGYAIREAIDLLDIELNLCETTKVNALAGQGQAASKRNKKLSYAKAPLFLRAFAYFIYRYIFRLGFTEGKEGFLWHFLQGWWYRTLVDAKIFEIKKVCGNDTEKIIGYIKSQYNIDCRNI
jgi:glycosyltransferase involved in cell wall biosynthesis